MPELMTKQDAIEYLLYMKHDVYAKSPMDIALDTAIEALKPAQLHTNGDRIRQMTDEELAEYLGSSICDRRESGDCQRFKNCEECKLSWILEEVSEHAGSKTD